MTTRDLKKNTFPREEMGTFPEIKLYEIFRGMCLKLEKYKESSSIGNIFNFSTIISIGIF